MMNKNSLNALRIAAQDAAQRAYNAAQDNSTDSRTAAALRAAAADAADRYNAAQHAYNAEQRRANCGTGTAAQDATIAADMMRQAKRRADDAQRTADRLRRRADAAAAPIDARRMQCIMSAAQGNADKYNAAYRVSLYRATHGIYYAVLGVMRRITIDAAAAQDAAQTAQRNADKLRIAAQDAAAKLRAAQDAQRNAAMQDTRRRIDRVDTQCTIHADAMRDYYAHYTADIRRAADALIREQRGYTPALRRQDAAAIQARFCRRRIADSITTHAAMIMDAMTAYITAQDAQRAAAHGIYHTVISAAYHAGQRAAAAAADAAKTARYDAAMQRVAQRNAAMQDTRRVVLSDAQRTAVVDAMRAYYAQRAAAIAADRMRQAQRAAAAQDAAQEYTVVKLDYVPPKATPTGTTPRRSTIIHRRKRVYYGDYRDLMQDAQRAAADAAAHSIQHSAPLMVYNEDAYAAACTAYATTAAFSIIRRGVANGNKIDIDSQMQRAVIYAALNADAAAAADANILAASTAAMDAVALDFIADIRAYLWSKRYCVYDDIRVLQSVAWQYAHSIRYTDITRATIDIHDSDSNSDSDDNSDSVTAAADIRAAQDAITNIDIILSRAAAADMFDNIRAHINPTARLLLNAYLLGMTTPQAAAAVGISRQAAWKTRRAIQSVTRTLYPDIHI